MPRWLIKSALHKIISVLPASHRLNELQQTWLTGSLNLTALRFEHRLEYCRRNLQHFEEFGSKRESFSALELGTGWYPVVPVGLYLSGAAEVWAFDIAPHLRRSRVECMLRLFIEYHERGDLQKYLPRACPERIETLRKALESTRGGTVEALLEPMNIHVRVRDAQDTRLNPAAIDLFVSNSVLEYIPRPVLLNILLEFKRVARPGAVNSNFINLSDEFAQFDRSITQFNFLKYPARRWKLLDSPLTGKSRLRIADYRAVFTEAGCRILREEDLNGEASDLQRLRLAPEFQKYSQADLLVLRAWLVAGFGPAEPT